MLELNLFRKSFFLGRLIWAQGSSDRHLDRIGRILNSCEVDRSEILVLNQEQFVSLMRSGLSKALVLRYQVFLVHGFEQLKALESRLFLRAIQTFRDLQLGLGIRLLLVSQAEVGSELAQLSQFNPVIVQLASPGSDPTGSNERVHALLEKATLFTGTPVERISEKAAIFIEKCFLKEPDEDVFTLLVMGLERSDGKVLRFRDFFPPKNFGGDPLPSMETSCN